MRDRIDTKAKKIMGITAAVLAVVVVFFEKINGLITFSYTKSITLADKEVVTIGWLDILTWPLTNGIFNTFFNVSSVVITAAIAMFVCMTSDRAKYGDYFVRSYGSEYPTALFCLSNRMKVWAIFVALWAFFEVVTNNFNMNTIAHVWRFQFRGGASVPTSPLSLTDIGTMVEYHYLVSIKRFFLNVDWSILEYAVYACALIWCAAKAHAITKREVDTAQNINELLTLIPAAVLALLTAIGAPYRLTANSEEEDDQVRFDLARTVNALHLPMPLKVWLLDKMADNHSLFHTLKDHHGLYTHQLMAAVNAKKQTVHKEQ